MADVTFADVDSWLTTHYVPSGQRLGIVIEASAGCSVVDAAAEAIGRHGLSADRRLARLQPRSGEMACRPEDVADFLVRYGHEYSVAILPTADRAVADAARHSGCVVLIDSTRGC